MKKNSEAHKIDTDGKGVILPSTVDTFTGIQTELTIDINQQIPKESFLFLKSIFNTCYDVLLIIVQSVESYVKLKVESMVLSNMPAISK